MPLTLRWVGQDELDRVAQTRMLCFSHATKDVERCREWIRADVRAKPGDFLLAERDGVPVGTSTALSMTMWVRGSAIPCQGVAFVGTIKTHRRRIEGEEGVATQVMRETLRMARERGQVVSALMPFRASFYEHFGYGLVERRNVWTVPLTALPHGSAEGLHFYQPGDLEPLVRFRQRVVERGQCEIERPVGAWQHTVKEAESGFFVVDRAPASDARGYLWIEHEKNNGKDYLRVMESNWEDMAALKRQLHFLASLRDQYFAVIMPMPVDLPLNWLLRETQIPHRLVNHMAAELRPHTRMQIRILDQKRFVEALHLPQEASGRIVVEVQESDTDASRFQVEINHGKASVSPSMSSPDFTCSDRVWASIACGDLLATRAVEIGLASTEQHGAARLLDALCAGPTPFCTEYF